MQEELSKLYDLQLIDSAILVIRKNLASFDTGKVQEAALNVARQIHETADMTLKTLKTDLHDSELELKSVEDKKKKFENLLYTGKISNPKELDNTEKEVEALGRQRGRLDDKILGLWDKIETATTDEAAAKKALASSQVDYDEHMRQYQAQKLALEHQWAKHNTERKAAAAKVDPTILSKYDIIRVKHGGYGISRIDADVCGICRTAVASFFLNRLKEGAKQIITCDNCKRILYFTE